jgi:hypothetical protein
MLVFRSVTTGLLGACLYFIVQLSGAQQPRAPELASPCANLGAARLVAEAVQHAPPTMIDVANGVPPLTVPSLVRLESGEHIASVDDRPVPDDLTAGALIAERARTHSFVDLTIDGHATTRRVLVLMH